MRLQPAQDIRDDAIKVAQFFSEKHEDYGLKDISHFMTILDKDPSLDNIFFFRESQDGAAHRDTHAVHLRRTTDRDIELFRAGSNMNMNMVKDRTDISEGDEADIMIEVKRKMPPLLAFIDAERYDSAKDDRKAFMLSHLLLHYDPVNNASRKHDITCFGEDIMFFPEHILIDSEGNPIDIGGGKLDADEDGEPIEPTHDAPDDKEGESVTPEPEVADDAKEAPSDGDVGENAEEETDDSSSLQDEDLL